MTKMERIMISRRPEWTKSEWTDREYVRQLRAERNQYTSDEAPYYVEVRHPKYRESRPYMYCPVVRYVWSLARARRMAYEQARKGMKATIYDNITDEPVN